MSSVVETVEPLTPIVEYSVSDAAIEKLRQKLGGLTIQKPADYEIVRLGIAEVRDLRVRVEKTRQELKAGALEYGRKVDSEAKRITAMLLDIEEPLKLEKQRVDEEKARARREKEEAERRKIEEELAAKRAAEEAEAARIKAERDAAEKAERDRIAAEQAAEAARLAEERKKLEAERAAVEAKLAEERKAAEAKRAAEEAKLAEERRKVEEERRRLEREEFERQARERAEREARERLEREAAAKKAAEERAAEERERLLAIRPDMEKLSDFARELISMEGPHVSSSEAIHFLDRTLSTIHEAGQTLLHYCRKQGLDDESEAGDEEAE